MGVEGWLFVKEFLFLCPFQSDLAGNQFAAHSGSDETFVFFRDGIRLTWYVHWTQLVHLTYDIRGVIDLWCHIQQAALTLSISCCFALSIGAP